MRIIKIRRDMRRQFGPNWCYFWFVGWDCISLGLHVSLRARNVEIHLPFGFIRIGSGHVVYHYV